MSDRLSALVDADDIRRLVIRYADRGHDFLLRLGCPTDQAPGVLLAAVGQLLDELATHPAEVGDLLGCWLGAAEERVSRAPQRPFNPEPADSVEAAVRAALLAMNPRSARLLLLRDTYDLPPGSVAVAVGLGILELRRQIGIARLHFLRRYDPAATRLMIGLPECTADLGDLTAWCDSTAPPGVGADLRSHAYRCLRCEGTAEIQRRARRILSRLPPRPLEHSARAALVAGAGRLAEARLSTLDAMLSFDDTDTRATRAAGTAATQTMGAGTANTRATGNDRGRRSSIRPVVVAASLGAALVSGFATGVAVAVLDSDPPTSPGVGVQAPRAPGGTVAAVTPTAPPGTAGAPTGRASSTARPRRRRA